MPRECQVGTVPVSITCVICGIPLLFSLQAAVWKTTVKYIFFCFCNLQTTHTTPLRLDLHASSADIYEVTAALCTASARPPRPARARIHSSRDCSHHRDIAYDLACYKHTRIPQDIGLLRQTPLSISALSTCARHSAEITFQNGIPRPRIP